MTRSTWLCRCWDDAELFEHLQPVEDQVEGDVLAVAEAERLDVVHRDRAPGGRDITRRTVQGAPVGSGEGAFLNGGIAGDVQGVHLDVRVGERAEPAGEELRTGRLSVPAHPAWRGEDHIVGEHAGEPVDVVGVKGFCPLRERFAYGHRHPKSPF